MLKLILPVLLPSWNFFDIIAPSPRVQYSLFKPSKKTTHKWKQLNPRPKKVTFIQMLFRLFWNANWNESLYVVSCSERLLVKPTEHSENEIINRIKRKLSRKNKGKNDKTEMALQFCIVVYYKENDEIYTETDFLSRFESINIDSKRLIRKK